MGETAAAVRPEKDVLDAFPNAIIAVDERGLITFVNPQAEATFGYPAAAMLGQPVEMLVAGGVAERHVAQRDTYRRHPVARPLGMGRDLMGRRSDGVEFPLEISLSPVQTAEGLRVYATMVDITARKATEAAHAESELRFRTVLEASPNPIIAVSSDGVIRYANPRAALAFGYDVEELVGGPLDILLPERVRGRHVVHRTKFTEHPVARPMGIGLDLAGLRKDGSEFPVEISLSPVETTRGLEVFATVVDITARKAAESHLLQAQKLESIGRLAGGVAHDFNNILFAIRGYAELLLEDLSSPTPVGLESPRRMAEAILEAGDRGAGLASQLLAFGRKQMVSPEVVDPAAHVEALQPMLRRLIGENVRLIVRSSGTPGRIRIDPGHLDQTVMNLVVNARDAMPNGGKIAIEIGRTVFDDAYAISHFEVSPGNYVLLSVADTGIGMDRETREHIFEPFFTTKEQGKGTGLGLATIYGIVRQAGGHIWLYSEPGRGSTFKLYFPDVDAPAPIATSSPTVVPVRQESGMILLVEDEPSVRDMTRIVLERAGYDVVAVAEGATALAELEDPQRPIDVLVTDVLMPGMSGIELADAVLAARSRAGVVLLSGYTAETLDVDRLLARGARFVTKPIASGELLRAIAEARSAVESAGRE